MEPREEVEELANHLINKQVNTRLRAINLAEHLIRQGYSRHPQQCKKELKELDFKVIFDMLFYRTQYSVDSCKYIADEICKKFGSPVSKEVKYPEEIHLMGCSAKIGKPRGNCDCGYVMWNKCIEECKRLNGNEGI